MKSQLPSTKKLGTILEGLYMTNWEEDSEIDLIITFQSVDLSFRELGAFLYIIDRFYGRLFNENFNSYALTEKKHLRIDQIESGSTVLNIINLLEKLPTDGALIFYLLIKFLPKVLKSGSESLLKISEAYDNYEKGRLTRYVRKSLKEEIQNDPTLNSLTDKDQSKLTKILESRFIKEKKYLVSASKFARKKVKSVELKKSKTKKNQ